MAKYLVLFALIACVQRTHSDDFASKALPTTDRATHDYATHRQLSGATLFQLEATTFNQALHAITATNHTLGRAYDPHEYDLDCYIAENQAGSSVLTALYATVCIVGLFGNTLVIYVVLRFSKMQTVTNIYILNLAIADECFLIGIPFLLYTMQNGSWPFGEYVCKAYMVSTSVTQFTSSIFLLIMSADRYIAVCHAITSPRYRTAAVAKVVSALAWLTSAILMLPVLLFASTVQHGEHVSCNIKWPEGQHRTSSATFILYALTLGFALPLTFILIFYCLVIRKLHTVGPQHKSTERKRSHRKVTRLVLTVIAVYIMCWLPYWVAQLALIHSSPAQCASRLEIITHLLVGCLGYSNSAMNPLMYAFLSENFRKCFARAFRCVTVSPRHTRRHRQLPAAAATADDGDEEDDGERRQRSRLSRRKQDALLSHRSLMSHLTTGTTTTTTCMTGGVTAATSSNTFGTVGAEGGATTGGGRATALTEPMATRGSGIAEIFAVFGGSVGGNTATTTMVDALSEESSSCGSSSSAAIAAGAAPAVVAVNINLLAVADSSCALHSASFSRDRDRNYGCTTHTVGGLNGKPPFLQTDL